MAARRLSRIAVAAFAVSSLSAQKPVFQPSGVLNGASSPGTDQPAIALQMILAIKGQYLAAAADIASTRVWPTMLAGTTVTFNGSPAPLLYVSPNQINLQVPTAIRGAATADIVVTTAAGSSDPVRARLHSYSWGIFTQDTTGCGPGAVFNIHADGSLALNTTQDSFDPIRDFGFAMFFTGLGLFQDRQDGAPWIYNPADNIAAFGTEAIVPVFGAPTVQQNQALKIFYAGPAPGLVGIDQVNAAPFQPDQIFESCNVPLYFANFSGSASQMVNVSVHKGGGACIEPAPNSLGIVTWQKNTVIDTGSTTSTEGVQIQFVQGQQLFFPNPGFNGASTSCCAPIALPPLNCPASLPPSIDAGPVTISGVTAEPATISPQGQNGHTIYQAAFPAGSLRGGTYQIAAAGGAVIGAFNASAAIAPPIAITSAPAPGTTLTLPYRITWTGGDSRSAMDLRFRVSGVGFGDYVFQLKITAKATDGFIEIPSSYFAGVFSGPGIIPNGDVEIILTQQPSAARPGYFSAPGLAEGGEQTWTYAWDYRGLKY